MYALERNEITSIHFLIWGENKSEHFRKQPFTFLYFRIQIISPQILNQT